MLSLKSFTMTCCYMFIFLTLISSVTLGFCPANLTTDITNGLRNGDSIIKDNVTYSKGSYFVENGSIFGCICSARNCITKCCLRHESLSDGECIFDRRVPKLMFDTYEEERFVKVKDINDFNYVLYGDNCDNSILLEPFYIQNDGSLYYFDNTFIGHWFNFSNYCVDWSQGNGTDYQILVYVCVSDHLMQIHYNRQNNVNYIGKKYP